MGVVGLVNLLSDAAEDTNIYRELDASARALLEEDDPAPLLRLYAQRLAVDEAYFGEPVREYSVELYLATSCLDYPQLFDMNASPAVRAAATGGRRGGAAGGDVQPVQHGRVARAGPEHGGVHRLPGLAEPDGRAAADVRATATVSAVAAGARARAANSTRGRPPPASRRCSLRSAGTRASSSSRTRRTWSARATPPAARRSCRSSSPTQALDSLDAACAPAVSAIHTVGVYASPLSEEPPLNAAPGAARRAPICDSRRRP